MNSIRAYEDKVPISDQADIADIVSFFIPEMAITNSNTLTIVLSHCDLNYILVVGVLAKAFKLSFNIFCNAFG